MLCSLFYLIYDISLKGFILSQQWRAVLSIFRRRRARQRHRFHPYEFDPHQNHMVDSDDDDIEFVVAHGPAQDRVNYDVRENVINFVEANGKEP